MAVPITIYYQTGYKNMSKKYPEYPVYNHNNCKEIDNLKVCALVREDKICLRKLPKSEKN